MNITLVGTKLISLYISILALRWTVNCQRAVLIQKESFTALWTVDLNRGHIMLSKPDCKQICCQSCIALFIEHRQSQFSIILTSLKFFRMVIVHWLSLKVIICISPWQDSQSFLKPLKADILYSYEKFLMTFCSHMKLFNLQYKFIMYWLRVGSVFKSVDTQAWGYFLKIC